MLTRRLTLAGGLALAACGTRGDIDQAQRTENYLAVLERRLGPGARLGVAALDTANGNRIGYRAEERFAMASTFKWLLAAAALERLDHSERIAYAQSDLVAYSPVTETRMAEGMTVSEIAEAAVTVSDNTAANLLLRQLDGPDGFTVWLRQNVDAVTRLDRWEPGLNENAPNDERDTTTPLAQANALNRLLVGDSLRRANRETLRSWMIASTTGRERIRAGLPDDWRVGDKTGTGMNGAHNDVAIAWAPKGDAVLIAVYQDGGNADAETRNGVHREVGALIADWV
ncbi:MAG TPA: class A beta-lactamase [Vitreimonas sp.]|uniref:class A beta-lactamase n=1 Tax=Vitreimonas sp. TaxID=3069702 RepID=UPI002D60FBFF|nr:class A beta-lactamase [Vitreimonas sp.]HYD88658.1 class A beta-lactamase [Vitreimonas sp.]